MKAAVIVHRWFARGADWAFSPEVKPMLLDIIKALDERQKSGRQGAFEIAVPGHGYLLGEIIRDSESLDPKARHRQPTMLRAVFLKQTPQKADAARLLERLGTTWPTRPGADANLTLVDTGIIVPGSPSVGQTEVAGVADRKTRRKIIITASLGVASLAAVGLALALMSSKGSGSNEAGKEGDKSLESIAQSIDKMKAQLSGWGDPREAVKPENVIQEYFVFLSQSEVWKEVPNSGHPYVEFVKHLPHHPPANDKWTKDTLETDLRKLVATLGDNKEKPDRKSTADDCLDHIDELMNYDSWRKKHREFDRVRDNQRFSDVPDPKVITFVEHFRHNASISPDLKEAADQMRGLLKRWNITVGADATPFDVFRAFFRVLQRPDFLERCRKDSRHAYWQFLARLPEDPSSLGWTCDDADQLKDALQDLLHHLGGAPKDEMVGGLIEAISDQMDYDKWLAGDGRNARTDGLPESKELIAYVEHFRGGTGNLGQEPSTQTTGPNAP